MQNPGASFKEVQSLTGRAWTDLTPEEQEPYREQARKAKLERQREWEEATAQVAPAVAGSRCLSCGNVNPSEPAAPTPAEALETEAGQRQNGSLPAI